MKITVVRDIDSFRALEDEWNALLENSTNNTLSLRWEWMFHYYDNMCNGQELLLLLVRDDEEHLKGIAPFILRKERIITEKTFLELIGQRYSYHLGIIANCNNRDDVYREICAHLFENRKKWDVIKFTNLSDDQVFRKHLKTHLKGRGFFWRENVQNPCKVLRIRGSFDEYISSLGKHFSNKLKYKLRRLKRDFHVELSLPENEKDLMLFWDMFVSLHIGAVTGKGSRTVLLKQQYQRFYHCVAQAAYREGTLALIALKLDNEIAAIKYAIVRNKICYFLNSGYQRVAQYSLYLLSTMLCIEKLLESGVECFDFMGGGGDHKTKLGAIDEDGLTIEVLRTISFAEIMAKNALRRMAGKIMNRGTNKKK